MSGSHDIVTGEPWYSAPGYIDDPKEGLNLFSGVSGGTHTGGNTTPPPPPPKVSWIRRFLRRLGIHGRS